MLMIARIYKGIDSFFYRIRNRFNKEVRYSKLGLFSKGCFFEEPLILTNPQKIFMCENSSILHGAIFLMSDNKKGRFIIKPNSGSSQGLTVITGNHQRLVGHLFKEYVANHAIDIESDVIVEEDAWIGANVTLLCGVTVGRGATVGAGSVCIKSIPPYAVVMGNPAKVVGFNFTPEEIIEHEKTLYPEEERLPLDLLEKNYNKYFICRIKEIKEFTRLSL